MYNENYGFFYKFIVLFGGQGKDDLEELEGTIYFNLSTMDSNISLQLIKEKKYMNRYQILFLQSLA